MAAEGASRLAGPPAVRITSVGGFLGWWRDELAGLLPAEWRDRLRSSQVMPVAADGAAWRAFATVRGALVEASRMPTGLRPSPLQHANVWLLLGPDEALVRDAALPLAAEESLDEALGFELDRLTPLSAEQAMFGYQVLARDESEKQLTLRLAVAPRDVVERRVAALREEGARILGVGLLEEYVGEPRSLNLLPVEQRDKPRVASEVAATRALGALAAVLALAALAYPVWLKRESIIALQPRVEKARVAAEGSSRIASQIESLAGEHNFVMAKKLSQPSMASLVEELSKQLPDNTWVQQLDVKPGPKAREVQIAGETGSSSALVEVLERSGLFTNATFKSPLTKGATPNTERYLLAAELKARELPAPTADEQLSAGAGPGSSAEPGASPAPAASAAIPATVVPPKPATSLPPAEAPPVPEPKKAAAAAPTTATTRGASVAPPR